MSVHPLAQRFSLAQRTSLGKRCAPQLDATQFVITKLDAQIDSFRTVLTTMRAALDQLDADRRDEIGQASAVLRKARAGARLPLEDITRRKDTPCPSSRHVPR